MSAVDVEAVLKRARDDLKSRGQAYAAEQMAIHAVNDLIVELSKAHAIIRLALNALPAGDAKLGFIRAVQTAGLEGEGVTRANERVELLARVCAPT